MEKLEANMEAVILRQSVQLQIVMFEMPGLVVGKESWTALQKHDAVARSGVSVLGRVEDLVESDMVVLLFVGNMDGLWWIMEILLEECIEVAYWPNIYGICLHPVLSL
jgi:hypothetical protein